MYLSRDFDTAFNPSTLSRLAHFNFDCFFSIWICKKKGIVSHVHFSVSAKWTVHFSRYPSN